MTRVLVGPSEGLVTELRRFFPGVAGCTTVIHNGIDWERFSEQPLKRRAETRRELGFTDDASVAIFVGGDWERKGLSKIVEALALAPSWHLIVVGDGDQARYEALAERLSVRDRLRLLGARWDVERMYGAADAFVFPSAYEVASLVTYEAAASGLPLLVSKINGTTELIAPGENGWFVESAADIAEHLNLLSRDPELRFRMGAAARQSSTRYARRAMIAGYTDQYRVLNAHSPRPPARLEKLGPWR